MVAFAPLVLSCLALASAGCGALSASAVGAAEIQDDDKIAGTKGLPISANVPSFMPKHLTGPHEGKTACPVCVYGLVPQLQIWVQEDKLEDGLRLARLADQYCVETRTTTPENKRAIAYLIVVAGAKKKVSEQTSTAIKALRTKHVFVTEVPSWEDAETSGLYGHSNSDKPGVRVYSVANRRLFKRWDNPTSTDWLAMKTSLAESERFVTNHTIADSTIAPEWEPGQRLTVRFRVVDSKSRPLGGVKVSAYQTDIAGHYNPGGWNRRDPRLKTLAWTDKDGWVTFSTIMPGAYPSREEPSHIHFGAVVAGKSHFRTLWFEGDPLLSKERRSWADQDEETLVIPLKRSGKVWQAEHSFQIRS